MLALVFAILTATVPLAYVAAEHAMDVQDVDETQSGVTRAFEDALAAGLSNLVLDGTVGGITGEEGTNADDEVADADQDGRPDWYLLHYPTPAQDDFGIVGEEVCVFVQSDYIYDSEPADDETIPPGTDTKEISPLGIQTDDGQLGVPTGADFSVFLMVYSPIDQGDCNYGSEDPVIVPGGIVVHPSGAAMPQSATQADPHRVALVDQDGMEVIALDTYVEARTGQPNPGPHVVLRIFDSPFWELLGVNTHPALTGYPTADNFPNTVDMTNVHLVSGTKSVQSPQFHDFDDDGYADIAEITGPPANPFDQRSTPADWDGDGTLNGADNYDYNPNKFRDYDWTIAITKPTAATITGSVSAQTVAVEWTATSTSANPVPLDYFEARAVPGGCPGDDDSDSLGEWPTGGEQLGTATIPATGQVGTGVGATITKSVDWDHLDVTEYDAYDGAWCFVVRAFDDPAVGEILSNLPFARRDVTVDNDAQPTPPTRTATVTDANAMRDDANQLSGGIQLDFTLTAARGGKVQLQEVALKKLCGANSGSWVVLTTEGGVDPGLGTFTSPHTASIAITAAQMDAIFKFAPNEGHLCGSSPAGQASPFAADGRVRLTFDEVEIPDDGDLARNDDEDLDPESPTTDFEYFNNKLPIFTGRTAMTMHVDDGQLPSEFESEPAGTKGTLARFRATVQDTDGSCGVTPTGTLFIRKVGDATFASHAMALQEDHSAGATLGTVPVVGPELFPPPADPSLTHCANRIETRDYEVVIPLDDDEQYEYYFEAFDGHKNRQDNVVPPAAGAAVVDRPSPTTYYTFTKDAATAGAVPCLGASDPTDCAVRLLETQGECDLEGFGGTEFEGEPCQGDPVGTAVGLAGFLQETVDGIVSGLSVPAGPPNPYVTVFCGGVTLPAAIEDPLAADPLFLSLHGCSPDDTDRDGFTDNDEEGMSDPYNPYSNPLDRDSDLIADALESIVDVQTHQVNWVNDAGPCNEDSDQFFCFAQVELFPTGSRSVTLYMFSDFSGHGAPIATITDDPESPAVTVFTPLFGGSLVELGTNPVGFKVIAPLLGTTIAELTTSPVQIYILEQPAYEFINQQITDNICSQGVDPCPQLPPLPPEGIPPEGVPCADFAVPDCALGLVPAGVPCLDLAVPACVLGLVPGGLPCTPTDPLSCANGLPACNEGEEVADCVARLLDENLPTGFPPEGVPDPVALVTETLIATLCPEDEGITLQACVTSLVGGGAGDVDGDGATDVEELGATCASNPIYAGSKPSTPHGCFPLDYDGDGYDNHDELAPQDGKHRSNPFEACSKPRTLGQDWLPGQSSCEGGVGVGEIPEIPDLGGLPVGPPEGIPPDGVPDPFTLLGEVPDPTTLDPFALLNEVPDPFTLVPL